MGGTPVTGNVPGTDPQAKMPGPPEILDTAISPSTYTGYLKNVIDQTKQQWAATQQLRDQESKVASSVIDAAKKGDFGTATEILLNHIGERSGQAAESLVGSAYKNLKANLTETDPNHGEQYAAPITPFPGVGDALESFAGEEAAANAAGVGTAAPAAESPGILGRIKGIFKGEKVAQPQAESAVRSAVEQGSKEAGMSITQPASLRTVAETPISKLETMADARYAEIDEAAGTDFKALNEKLSNTEYKIRQLTETEEDIAKEAALEKSRAGIIEKISAAKEQARAAGVDPKLLDEADAQFKQAQALKDFEAKILKNSSVVGGNTAAGTPETIDIEKATSAIQKLADSTKYGGSRLEQALGKQGADQLLKSMYAAQRAGVTAMKTQTLARWIAGIIGAGAVAAGGKAAYDVLR